MSFKNIEFEVENGLATLILNRPNRLNALSIELLDELLEVLESISKDDEIKVLLLTGKGKGFCAGADITLSLEKTSEALKAQGELSYKLVTTRYNPIVQLIRNMDKPVIGAVNGVAAGYGVSLALACDVVFAAESASFLQVFVPNLGLVPDGGATWLVPRMTTSARAMGMFLSGEKIKAKQAEEWGMIWKCLPDDQFMNAAVELATKLVSGPRVGIRSLKTAMNQTTENSLAEQQELEAKLQKICGATEDFVEGCEAFVEKRKPQFTGK